MGFLEPNLIHATICRPASRPLTAGANYRDGQTGHQTGDDIVDFSVSDGEQICHRQKCLCRRYSTSLWLLIPNAYGANRSMACAAAARPDRTACRRGSANTLRERKIEPIAPRKLYSQSRYPRIHLFGSSRLHLYFIGNHKIFVELQNLFRSPRITRRVDVCVRAGWGFTHCTSLC